MDRFRSGTSLKNSRIQSNWKDRFPEAHSFLCPLCGRSRRLPHRTQPGGWRHYLGVGITSFLFTILTWDWFDWKGMVCFLPFWMVFEFAYRWQTRAALACKDCGFDPFLYQIDLKWAKREVDSHWRRKYAEKGIPYPEKRAT